MPRKLKPHKKPSLQKRKSKEFFGDRPPYRIDNPFNGNPPPTPNPNYPTALPDQWSPGPSPFNDVWLR